MKKSGRAEKVKAPVIPPQPLQFPVDGRIQAILAFPGNEKAYEKVLEQAKQSQFLLEQAVLNLLAKYELVNDIPKIKEAGYEVMVNILPNDKGQLYREISIFKVLEKIEVPM